MTKSEYKEYGWIDHLPKSYHGKMKKILIMLPTDGSPILDVGCGNGFIANTLIRKGYNVYGVDASQQGVDIANKENGGDFM